MDLKRVEDLLVKYYEGRTSREEETYLKDFFSSGSVPSGMKADRLLFLSLLDSAEEVLPDDRFDEKLFVAIEEEEAKNGYKKRRENLTRSLVISITGIAAGILILIGSYFMMFERQMEENLLSGDEYTIDETRLAYEEARGALLLVSEVMNRGTNKLEPLSRMEKATRELHILGKFNQGTGELQALSRFDETVTSLSGNY